MLTRRSVLAGGCMVVAGSAVTSALGQSSLPARPAPPDVGRKFFANGRVMPFAGNTIICHLPQQGEDAEPFRALLDIYRMLPSHSFARKIAALPPSSYHMTLFGGANDKERRASLWPSGLPLDMPIAQCNRVLGDRLRTFRLGEEGGPYRMRIDLAEPPVDEAPLTIRLLQADEGEAARLRRLRTRLSETLGIRAPDQDQYRFHITLAYLVEWLTDEEKQDFRRTLAGWKDMLATRAPVLMLGAPEYCTLEDMFAFDRQFYLS